ncbi:hypothetical protein BDV3_000204 [Batrachochytrium dendrobatidis]|uniref:NodB homology domain-containing protein n=2 Tax=Batrachochytrium dendrobatidis TaxID=109871 RepID=A0A177WAM7_BATDL|nr:hypothetical protein BDEG_21221 [Batrachochytrium dendrobatidis JEL423]
MGVGIVALTFVPEVYCHPSTNIASSGLVNVAASAPLIISGYDFSAYPAADVPPPINATWNTKYNIAAIPNTIPVKLPMNSMEIGPCPLTNSSCDWGCFNCTQPTDAVACPQHNSWALSYDDGPSPDTPALLALLAKLNVKATFCVVGSRVLARPEILRQAYDAGHQICAHTWSHRFLTSQTNEQIVAEFEWGLQIIEQVTGARPAYARPPFGDMDDRVRAVLKSMNLTPLLWNRDTFDWNLGDPNSGFQAGWITGNFTNWIATAGTTSTGFMSLEHDLYPQSAAQTLPALQLVYDAKFQIQPASTCLGTNPYTSVVSVPIPAVGPNTGRKTGSQIALPTNRNTGPNSKSAGILGQSPTTASLVAGLSVLASLGLQSIC